jgi:hypothetical protein
MMLSFASVSFWFTRNPIQVLVTSTSLIKYRWFCSLEPRANTSGPMSSAQCLVQQTSQQLLTSNRRVLSCTGFYLRNRIITRSIPVRFFQNSNIISLLNTESWDMDESFDPRVSDSLHWTVYSFIKCLRAYESHPAILPINGLSFIEAKQIGSFIYYSWFRAMDIKEGHQASHFGGLILGKRLQYTGALLLTTQAWFSSGLPTPENLPSGGCIC